MRFFLSEKGRLDECLEEGNKGKGCFSIGLLRASTATSESVILAHGMAAAEYACGTGYEGKKALCIFLQSTVFLPGVTLRNMRVWGQGTFKIRLGAAPKLQTDSFEFDLLTQWNVIAG